MTYLDQHNETVQLGGEYGRGGEATIYKVLNSANELAKIYHRQINNDKVEKIEILSRLANSEIRSFTALPSRLLRDSKTKTIVGFTMPFAGPRQPVFQLSVPKSRRQKFPDKDYRFVTRVALNAACAFSATHAAGLVIGDVNESGVLVANDATVFLVDCDSFQVEANGKTYFCEVGVPMFTPPELQGQSLRVRRTAQHDAFGLAVLLFNLLFMGRHPFAGQFTGAGDMPIERAIAERRFAYLNDRHLQMLAPPDALALQEVGDALCNLFRRAFTSSPRPLASEWVPALRSLESGLQRCALNSSHWFPHRISCPWCRIEGATGVVLFAIVSVRSAAGNTVVEVSRLWEAIEAVKSVAPIPFPTIPLRSPSPEGVKGAQNYKRAVRFTFLVWFSPIAFELALLATDFAALGVFLVVINMTIGVKKIGQLKKAAVAVLRDELQKNEADLRMHQPEWGCLERDNSFAQLKSKADEYRRQLMELPGKRAVKLAQLEKEKRKQQLEAFLDSFSIADAKIEGIGPGRLALLRAEQIVTAGDISRHTKVSGFGPVYMGRLLAWRAEVERRFVFNPTRAVEPAAVAKVENEYSMQVQSLSATLKRIPSELQTLNKQTAAKRDAILGKALPLVERIGQIRADLKLF